MLGLLGILVAAIAACIVAVLSQPEASAVPQSSGLGFLKSRLIEQRTVVGMHQSSRPSGSTTEYSHTLRLDIRGTSQEIARDFKAHLEGVDGWTVTFPDARSYAVRAVRSRGSGRPALELIMVENSSPAGPHSILITSPDEKVGAVESWWLAVQHQVAN
jgi:hypothetical protein